MIIIALLFFKINQKKGKFQGDKDTVLSLLFCYPIIAN